MIVCVLAKFGEELGTEVIIAAFTLHRFNQDPRNSIGALCKGLVELRVGLGFLSFDVIAHIAVDIELAHRVVNTWPRESWNKPTLSGSVFVQLIVYPVRP